MAPELKLYVKSWCPWCVTAKQFLNSHDYEFEEVHVDRDATAYDEMIRLSGQSYTPTLVVDGKVLADFGPEELDKFLTTHSIRP